MQPALFPDSPASLRGRPSRALRPRWPLETLQAREVQALLLQAFGPAQPSARTVERLLAQTHYHPLEKGPLALSAELEPPAWWLLLEGRMAAGRPSEDGGTLEQRLVQPGQWFDLASAWLGAQWLESAVCLTPVILAALPLEGLLECAREDEQLQWGMGQAMAAQIRQLTEGRHELATKDVLGRLALWLLRQAQEANSGYTFRLPMQKRAIARQLVMAQATLSRSLRRLVALGCIELSGYNVTLTDPAQLQQLAGQVAR